MLIFVSSIGRSGTRYLAESVRALSFVPAFQKAEPICHGGTYRAVNRGRRPADLARKVKQILADAEKGGGWYCETSQIFVRGFAEAVLETGRAVTAIQLLRDPLEVAKSYCNRDSYPSHPDRPWRLPLNLPRSKLRVDGPPRLTPFQENLADWLENEVRLAELRPRLSRVAPLRFEDLGRLEVVRRILAEWGAPLREGTGGGAPVLERNANPVPTRVGREEWAEAEALIERLRDCEFDRRVFEDPVYDGFAFVERLRGVSPAGKGTGRGEDRAGAGPGRAVWWFQNIWGHHRDGPSGKQGLEVERIAGRAW